MIWREHHRHNLDRVVFARERDDSGVVLGYRRPVLAVRRLLAQRHFAALLCAAVLVLKLLVPTGYMIASDHDRIAITLCPGVATMAMPAMHGQMADHGKKDQGKAEMPCAFAGLSAHALGAIDPVLLATLIVFLVTVGLAPAVLPAPARRSYLRPPLRAPPAFR